MELLPPVEDRRWKGETLDVSFPEIDRFRGEKLFVEITAQSSSSSKLHEISSVSGDVSFSLNTLSSKGVLCLTLSILELVSSLNSKESRFSVTLGRRSFA